MGNDKRPNRSFVCQKSLQKPFSVLYGWMHHFVFGKSQSNSSDGNCKSRKSIEILFSSIKSKALFAKKNDFCRDVNDGQVRMPNNSVPAPRQSQFMDLPVHIREFIYDLIHAEDVLVIRLTSHELKRDVESHRGLSFKLHDAILDDFESILRTTGIEKLIIEKFVDERKVYDYFPYPHLLQVLEINGRVSEANFELLLNRFPNLTKLVVSFQHSDQQFRVSDWKSNVLYSLKTLEIYSNTFGTTESSLVGDSIKAILCDMHSPNLIHLIVNVVGFIPARIQEYHLWVQIRLSKNSHSLKNVEIHLKQLMHPFILDDVENIQIINEWTNNLQLETFHLDINSHMQLWYPIMDTQSNLRILKLAVRNQSWSRLILVLDKSAETLQEVMITGLSFPLSNDGTRTTPLDVGLLENLKLLKTLEIQHQHVESRNISVPAVIRTSLLPKTLKSLKLCNLLLKPHQTLFFLLKLPLLNELALECWTGDEETLAAFLTVLTFLVKFDLTTVQLIKIMESRIKLENLQNDIERMSHTLYNKTKLLQDKSELYSTLILQRVS
ncbi:unnamed protein product [Orchesella dallaii]|uniref:F-box domain-containing protein n=1 Tax=Orchesella dallaii TaxID=48710 RepID=A0ABP1RDC0_9HEXA